MSAHAAKTGSVKTGVRVVAMLLIVGGIAGVAIGLWAEAAAYNPSHLIFFGLAILAFGWSVWVGVDLWQGKPQSYKWAQILFIAQIPNISFHAFAYQFYVGLVFGLSFTQEAASKLNFEFELGSRLNLQVSSVIENLVVGVNLIAIAALIYLTKQIPEAKLPSSFDR